jgi:hypothetical protein
LLICPDFANAKASLVSKTKDQASPLDEGLAWMVRSFHTGIAATHFLNSGFKNYAIDWIYKGAGINQGLVCLSQIS